MEAIVFLTYFSGNNFNRWSRHQSWRWTSIGLVGYFHRAQSIIPHGGHPYVDKESHQRELISSVWLSSTQGSRLLITRPNAQCDDKFLSMDNLSNSKCYVPVWSTGMTYVAHSMTNVVQGHIGRVTCLPPLAVCQCLCRWLFFKGHLLSNFKGYLLHKV
jgi:hypothetical protein